MICDEALRRLKEDFHFKNNPGLCGTGFSSLRACTAWDNTNEADPTANIAPPTSIPRSASLPLNCSQSHCSSSSSRLPSVAIVGGAVAVALALTVLVLVCTVKYRRAKQKVGDKSDTSEDRISIDHRVFKAVKTNHSPSPSRDSKYEGSSYKYNLEEVESATHHFSEANLLGKSKFSAVYKGVLKDGCVVAIKSISKNSCKMDEDEFMKGMSLLNSLKHENLVKLKGFCSSKARGECFLIYEFVSRGNLSQYLDDGGDDVLDWPTRVSIVHGIARGWYFFTLSTITYLNTFYLAMIEILVCYTSYHKRLGAFAFAL